MCELYATTKSLIAHRVCCAILCKINLVANLLESLLRIVKLCSKLFPVFFLRKCVVEFCETDRDLVKIILYLLTCVLEVMDESFEFPLLQFLGNEVVSRISLRNVFLSDFRYKRLEELSLFLPWHRSECRCRRTEPKRLLWADVFNRLAVVASCHHFAINEILVSILDLLALP